MVKVKKTQKHNYKEKKQTGVKKYNHEIIGILMLALGILILLSFYFENTVGIFGSAVRGFLLGMFGLPAYLLPPMLVIYSVFVIFKKDDGVFRIRTVYTLILLVLASAMLQTGFYHYKTFENQEPLRSLAMMYEQGKALRGGGVAGGLISLPFLLVFQVAGTIVILTALSLVDIILLTNISIANFLRNIRRTFILWFQKAEDARKKKNNENSEDTGFESGVVRDDGELSLEFNSAPKVIDFKIEKTARELKERTEADRLRNGASKKGLLEDSEDIQFRDDKKVEVIFQNHREFSQEEAPGLKNDKTSVRDSAEIAGITNDVREEISKQAVKDFEYKIPPFDLLNENREGNKNIKSMKNTAMEGAKKLEETLKSFGVEARVINISRGPAVTRYELQPSPGVKVSKIVNLSDDISLNLAAAGVRIEAPIPGKAAIGIEVPNKEVETVYLREVIETSSFLQHNSKLAFGVGKDISGENIVADIAKMPHLLVAGATGSGKSVCINSLIMSILFKASPEEVKLLMVDPKVVELGVYNGIPHLLIPVVTDPKKAAGALNWAVQEMVNRYKLFADKGVRDLKGYNALLKDKGEEGILPQIMIIIDELADLMMVAPNDVEDAICRLAQMARAAGMHLIIATQRPSVDVITGVIKANIPSRIAFAVSSQVDSRTILDMGGAEKLLGKGDMLFYPVGEPKPIRIKCAFVSDKEVEKAVEYIKSQGNARYDESIIEEINSENESESNEPGDNDELLPQAIDIIMDAGQASVSLIQRKFKVGYARAARIIDQMEARGIVGGFEGSKPRQVLISRQQWQEMKMADLQKTGTDKKEI